MILSPNEDRFPHFETDFQNVFDMLKQELEEVGFVNIMKVKLLSHLALQGRIREIIHLTEHQVRNQ